MSTVRQDCLLVRESLQYRRLTVPDLRASWSESGIKASQTTVRRRLQDVGLKGHIALKKPLLTHFDILGDSAVSSTHFLGYVVNYWLQDDGEPCRRTKIVNEWNIEQGIQTLSWPPQCPDINPIENLCGTLREVCVLKGVGMPLNWKKL